MAKRLLVVMATSLAACSNGGSAGPHARGTEVAAPDPTAQAVEPAAGQEPTPPPASGLQFTAVSVGDEHACALDRAGDLDCWGEGSRLDGVAQKYDQPFRIDHVKGVVAVAVGGRTFAVTKDGELVCLGCTSDRSPLRIGGLAPVRSETNGTWVCVLEREGAVKCWRPSSVPPCVSRRAASVGGWPDTNHPSNQNVT